MNKFESVNEMGLKVNNVNGIDFVRSLEVAEMTGKEHKNLLRDINNYREVLHSSNLSSDSFFVETQYVNSRNQVHPMFLITKKGCDMVANKMTGEKGILFTAAYVTAFEEMQKQFKPLSQLEVLQQSIALIQEQQQRIEQLDVDICNVGDKVTEQEQKVGELYDSMRIDSNQEFKISSLGKQKVMEVLGGKNSIAYNGFDREGRSISKVLFAGFWRDFKNHFHLSRKGDLLKKDYEEAEIFIGYWNPSTSVLTDIKHLNNSAHEFQEQMPF